MSQPSPAQCEECTEQVTTWAQVGIEAEGPYKDQKRWMGRCPNNHHNVTHTP